MLEQSAVVSAYWARHRLQTGDRESRLRAEAGELAWARDVVEAAAQDGSDDVLTLFDALLQDPIQAPTRATWARVQSRSCSSTMAPALTVPSRNGAVSRSNGGGRSVACGWTTTQSNGSPQSAHSCHAGDKRVGADSSGG